MSEPLDPDMFADCDPVAAPMRIGDKWTAKIITCLQAGPRRFSELQAPLRGITPKVLTASLRALERDGMITRTAYPEIPPRVEYELTPLGHTLFEPMAAQCAWTREHLPELLAARGAHETPHAEPAGTGTISRPGHTLVEFARNHPTGSPRGHENRRSAPA